MNKFTWLLILFVTVVAKASQSSIMFALGEIIPWYILGLVLSPITWFASKKNRKSPWLWFNWLNAGAYIMIILFVLNIGVKALLPH